MPVDRSATNKLLEDGSKANPPSAGPGFGAPSSVTLANNEILPLAPSMRQIEPGPPCIVGGPNSPDMNAAPGAPSVRRCAGAFASTGGRTMGRP